MATFKEIAIGQKFKELNEDVTEIFEKVNDDEAKSMDDGFIGTLSHNGDFWEVVHD